MWFVLLAGMLWLGLYFSRVLGHCWLFDRTDGARVRYLRVCFTHVTLVRACVQSRQQQWHTVTVAVCQVKATTKALLILAVSACYTLGRRGDAAT
jgi:hypothetical protein